MSRNLVLLLTLLALLIGGLWTVSGAGAASSHSDLNLDASSTPTPTPHVATAAELQAAQAEWSLSRHANTFDNGQGANTTCARCKSPANWDPHAPAAEQALNCSSCKRIPGAPRPELEGGVPVAQSDWHNIPCQTCHQPVGDSYSTAISFYNYETHTYEPVANVTELCAKCHEGQHGFEVIEEQAASPAHQGWECTKCHGAHGAPAQCTDCHDPTTGSGAADHARHPEVNCTACHDAGGLSIWLDTGSKAKHLGTYIPVRFAHTLTSWPSHDLQKQVDCRRCHHPPNPSTAALAAKVPCDNPNCHPSGASLNWCPAFDRNSPP